MKAFSHLFSLILIFLSTTNFFAQTGALQFDGIDDYASIEIHPAIRSFNEGPWSLELSFKPYSLNDDQILVSQISTPNNISPFAVGINTAGNIFIILDGENYLIEETQVNTETCSFLSLIFLPEQIDVYLNGELIQSIERSSILPEVGVELFYLGQLYPDNNTSFEGLISEFRLFNDARSQSEVLDYQNNLIPFNDDGVVTLFRFNIFQNNVGISEHVGHNYAKLGDWGSDNTQEPLITAESCIDANEPESISSLCSPPACVSSNLPSNELMCNGNFEQYCSKLERTDSHWQSIGFPSEPWLLPHHAYIQTLDAPLSAQGSDVTSWQASPSFSPDFYVRNGIAWNPNRTQHSFPFFPNAFPGQYPNWLGANPPQDSWNGQGNAFSAIASVGPSSGEGLINSLNYPIEEDSTYVFSGWFYKQNMMDFAGAVDTTSNPATLKLYAHNGTSSVLLGSTSIPHWNKNPSSTNHWSYHQIRFKAKNIPLNSSQLYITAVAPVGDSYLFMDDLSLLKLSKNQMAFPQYIYSGDINDYHHRVIKSDDSGYVYALTAVESVNKTTNLTAGKHLPLGTTINDTRGSYLVKFDSSGMVLWEQYYPDIEIIDFDFANNNTILAVGTNAISTSISNVITNSQSFEIDTTCTDDIINFNTPQLIISRINCTNGALVYSRAYGGTGQEYGYGVHVDQNQGLGYILCNITASGCDSSIVTNSGVKWSVNSIITETDILTWDLNSNGPAGNFKLNLEGSKILCASTNGLITAGDSNLYHIDKSSQSVLTHETLSGLFLSDISFSDSPFGEKLILSYLNPNLIEVRDMDSLHLDTALKPGLKAPIALESHGEFFYVLMRQLPQNSNSPNHVIAIEKYSIDSLKSIWHKESSGYGTTSVSYYTTHRYNKPADIYKFPTNKPNQVRLGFLGDFLTLDSSWVIVFDSKPISSIDSGTYGNTFVTTLDDYGNSALFKSMAAEQQELAAQANIFPNPVTNILVFNTKEQIIEALLSSSSGQLIYKGSPSLNNGRQVLDCRGLKPGLYFIQYRTLKREFIARFIKK